MIGNATQVQKREDWGVGFNLLLRDRPPQIDVCSHLAVGGAPAKAIQELAGHEDLTTTLRYMHLSPAAREGPSLC